MKIYSIYKTHYLTDIRASHTKKILSSVFPLVVFLTIFLLLEYKASYTPFTQDEAGTLEYNDITLGELLSYQNKGCSANNHIINSLYFKVVNKLFGLNEFFARQLSIFSFIVYFAALMKFKRLVASTNFGSVFLVSMCFNSIVFEYFNSARGYAISIAFFTYAVSLMLEILTVGVKNKAMATASLFLCLSVSSLSNFSYIFPSIAVGIMLNAAIFYLLLSQMNFDIFETFRHYFRTAIFTFSLIFVFFIMIYLYPSANAVVGCDKSIPQSDSLWSGTLLSLIRMQVAFPINPRLTFAAKMFYLFGSMIIIFFNLKQFCTTGSVKANLQHPAFIVLSIMLLIALLQTLNLLLNNVGYPLHRAAAYYAILFLLLIFLTFVRLGDSRPQRFVLYVTYGILAVSFCSVAYSNIFLSNCFSGECGNVHMSPVLDSLVRINNESDRNHIVKVQSSCTSVRVFKFYISKFNLKNINVSGVCYNHLHEELKGNHYLFLDVFNLAEKARIVGQSKYNISIVADYHGGGALYRIQP